MKISRILHAGYLFESKGTRILFDPLFENPFSVNCSAYPNVAFGLEQIQAEKFSAVFISHYHDDHCSLQSLDLLDRETPIYMYCLFEEMFSLLRKLGFENVFSLQLNEPVVVGSFEVIPRQALDADVDSMFHVKADGVNVLNVVDSWIDPSAMDRLSKTSWDLILWPFQNMREMEVIAPSRAEKALREIPVELAEQLQILNPRFLVPSSCQFIQEPWSWYRKIFFPISYLQFQKQIEVLLPKTKIVRMNPSVSLEFLNGELQAASPLTWVQPLGEQNVDYEFDENINAPETSEIAKHFSPLTEPQSLKVFKFCESEMAKKFAALPVSEDPYFEKERVWKLSVFDHWGRAKNFFYKIDGNSMNPISSVEAWDWSTEISLTKFYGALFEGETLTSLYVRINDAKFENLVEDPLLRCLFDGAFASYQKAQLRRLTGSAE